MQRMLSLATLLTLGGGVWMFLSEGGLNQLAVEPGAAGQTTTGQVAGGWNTGAAPAAAGAPQISNAPLQPTSIGAAAPPLSAGPLIRLGSFNIEVFGDKKLSDPRIAYTLAQIVRQFDVMAIQEIRTQNEQHMNSFVQLVNSTGRRFDFVVGPRIGNTVSKEQYAFVFDADKIIVDRQSVYTVGDPDNLLHREPLVASFSTKMPASEAFTFILVNVHTDPDVVPAELEALAEVFRVVRRASNGEDDVIMLGDFNADDNQMTKQSRLGQLPGVTALVHGVFSNTRQKNLYDNILVHGPSTTEYAGRSGVYNIMQQVQLSLSEAEQVSDHFPVWAEFSAYERDYTGRIASRRTNVR